MRSLATWILLVCLTIAVAGADSVSYTGDPYLTAPGSGSGTGGNVLFQYTMTPSAGSNPTYFFVVVYPDASGSDYSNINTPGQQGFVTQGHYTNDLGAAIGDATYNNVSGIYWTGSAISTGPAIPFSFESSAHGVVWQSWDTNGIGNPADQTIEGPAPEPTTFALFGSGLIGLLGCGLRRRRARQRAR